MFTPWIKRKALKRDAKVKGSRLVVQGEPPSMIMLLSLSALLVLVGVFVVQHSLADKQIGPAASPAVTATPSLSPSASPAPQR